LLEKEPLWFPSRNRFDFNPATSDRQLWAIGMVVVQWGMLEFIIEQQICDAIQGHPDLTAEYKKLRNFKQTVDLLQRLVELKTEPTRSIALRLVQRIRDLADQRDKVIHKLWGGGMQEGTWANPEGHETTDAALLRDRDEPYKGKSTDALRNAPPSRTELSFDRPLTKPITGIAGCCARAASGHDAAAPPSSAMNSRRLIRSPRQRGQVARVAPRGRAPWRS
jgi:hypothetical protein